MKFFRILSLILLAVWGGNGAVNAAEPQRPRLVLNIIVDGMRNDYLSRFGKNLGTAGINRIINNGTICSTANYDFSQTNTAAGVATIVTGANPDTHGIISSTWKDFTTNETISVEQDNNYKGLGCDDENRGRVSAQRLMVSSIGDQLKRYYKGSRSYSVAMTPTSAVVAGGRLADAAFWFDTQKGKWMTSSYYVEKMPEWARKFNNADNISPYCTRNWTTLFEYKRYVCVRQTDIQSDSSARSFINQLFAQRKNGNYKDMMTTPFGVNMMLEFAKKVMIYEDLGRDDITDMLTVVLEPFGEISQKYGPDSREVEDALYRLDTAIADLMSFIDIQLGSDNVLIVFTSSRGMSEMVDKNPKSLSSYFNTTQFKAIVNGFLNAQLGTEEWVTYYNDRQLYLNRRAIYAKGLKLADVQNMVAGFAIQFRGVASAITGTALQTGGFTSGLMRKIQHSYNPRTSGDLIINLQPGWIDEVEGVVSNSGSAFRYDTNVPLIWSGWKIPKNVAISRNVDMCDITATLSAILRIPAPESTSGVEIKEIIEQ